MTKEEYEYKLQFLRTQVDSYDVQLVSYLNMRMKCCEMIGRLKNEYGKDEIFQPEREEEIIKKNSEQSRYKNMVESIWPHIMEFSKGLQENVK